MANLGEYLVIFYRLDRRTGRPIHSWADVVSRRQVKELNHWAHDAKPAQTGHGIRPGFHHSRPRDHRAVMLSRLILPPGYSVRIDVDPAKAPLDAMFTVFYDGAFVGEYTVPVARLDNPADLQDFADQLTRRGLRLTKERA